MSDELTPRVRALLDRLEPPALPADFADRLVAKAEAMPNLPPLPPYRRRHVRRVRRIALGVGVAGLVGLAAAAAVVPADVWRKVPVISGIVDLISPAQEAPAQGEPSPAAPKAPEPSITEERSRAEQPGVPPVPEAWEAAAPARQDRAVIPPSSPQVIESGSPANQPELEGRAHEALPQPIREREMPASEPPAADATAAPREATAVDTRTEPVPARASERDAVVDTRQQTRERTTSTRETTRDRIDRRERIERRERQTSRPQRTD